MKYIVLMLCAFAVLTFQPNSARADWFDGFEDYAVGSGLHGQGQWFGWENDPGADAFVSDLYAHSGLNSAQIISTSDIVHRYAGYTTGVWEYIAWMYIPTPFTGQTYFILLNTYAGQESNWSVQVYFTESVVHSEFDDAELPVITDQWVELKVVIDLDADMQTFFYGGTVLYQKSWTEGVSGGGVLNIGGVDLYGNGADTVYYDDMSLSPPVVSEESVSWGRIKNLYR